MLSSALSGSRHRAPGWRAPSENLANWPQFDHEFYSAIVGNAGMERREAALHYARFGAKMRMPLNAVHRPHLVPDRVWDAAESGDLAKLVWWLSTQRGANSMLSVEVDESDAFELTGASSSAQQIPTEHDTVRVAGGPPVPWKNFRDGVMRSLALLRTAAIVEHTKRDGNLEFESRISTEIDRRGSGTHRDHDPLVSIIVVAWNQDDDVARTVRSVMQQTYERWELIIVDHGSDNFPHDVVEQFVWQDERVRVVDSADGGPSRARAWGLRAAQGEYVAFLDAPYCWRPAFLAIAVPALALRPKIDAVCGSIAITQSNGATTYSKSPFALDTGDAQRSLGVSTVLARTSSVRRAGGLSPEVTRWFDGDPILTLSAQGCLDYVPVIASEWTDDRELSTISVSRVDGDFSRVAQAPLLEAVSHAAFPKPQNGPRVSLVVLGTDHRRLRREIEHAFELFGDESFECIVAMEGATPRDVMEVMASVALNPTVMVLPFAGRYTAGLMANLGVSVATGEVVIVINDQHHLRSGGGTTLARRAMDRQVAATGPLLSHRDGTLISCGREWFDEFPMPFRYLSSLSPDDAAAEVERRVASLDVGVIAFKRDDFHRVRGFEVCLEDAAAWIDFGLRLADVTGGELIVCTEARGVAELASPDIGQTTTSATNQMLIERHGAKAPRADTAWSRLGWSVLGVELSGDTHLRATPILRRTPSVAADGLAALRWALKVGAEYSTGGDRWGDVPFAADLCRALTDLGHNAVVDRFHRSARRNASPDDVHLVLRGLHAVEPVPGRHNLLWIISHPELVGVRELERFDGVLVASTQWAEHLSAFTEVPVLPLLQAADVRRFTPSPTPVEESGKALFVGTPRGPVGRRIVRDAVSAGLPLEVWGPGWESHVPEEFVAGHHLPNRELPGKYARASIVLSDHLQGMAQAGFVNNRVFEALACGARVVSDPVTGLSDLFGSSVATYGSVDELRWIFEHRHEQFGGRTDAEARREKVVQLHSFSARAQELVEFVRSASPVTLA